MGGEIAGIRDRKPRKLAGTPILTIMATHQPLSTDLTVPTIPQLKTSTGSPYPLGATAQEDDSVNFAVTAQHGASVKLCLFTDSDRPNHETHQIELTDSIGDAHFIAVAGIPAGAGYGYRVDGAWDPDAGHYFNSSKLLLDPYVKQIDGPSRYFASMKTTHEGSEICSADSGHHAPRGIVPDQDNYDWENDTAPAIPMTDSVITELHVKGFSKLNPAVPEEIRGTYAGLGHPASIKYLQDIGITTVQLLPVHQHLDDSFLLNRGLVNYWGYNTIGFFAPEARYAHSGDPVTEFRDMVKSLHLAGIEVILDVVYNHTGEAGTDGPTCLLRGYNNLCHYHTEPSKPGHYRDYTGCGNSVDVSHPRTLQFVMDSLRYWVTEMHVDGFRFDLAVEMGRSPDSFKRRAAFFQAVYQDPVLGQTKLIAEPWDLGPDGYQIGNFPTNWCELNGKFRDISRRFWRGDHDVLGEFAGRITGSEDLFLHNHRLPGASINLLTSHDGFTLNDLVSYHHKHNLANGENNNDGDSHNLSYNHGAEGPTDDPDIIERRHRQIRNFLATLFCSQGVPFLLAGDERLRTQHGNNNTYCQDNELSWISWDDSQEAIELQQFVQRLTTLRRENPALRRSTFFNGRNAEGSDLPDVCWMRSDGVIKERADWNTQKAGAFEMLIPGSGSEKSLLFLFNARPEATRFHFPAEPACQWELLIDTQNPAAPLIQAKQNSSVTLIDRSLQIWAGIRP
tara:strand:- start:2581 stop:4779 length:2199 start_codon:yes stop_codon:yes gene_type:complete